MLKNDIEDIIKRPIRPDVMIPYKQNELQSRPKQTTAKNKQTTNTRQMLRLSTIM